MSTHDGIDGCCICHRSWLLHAHVPADNDGRRHAEIVLPKTRNQCVVCAHASLCGSVYCSIVEMPTRAHSMFNTPPTHPQRRQLVELLSARSWRLLKGEADYSDVREHLELGIGVCVCIVYVHKDLCMCVCLRVWIRAHKSTHNRFFLGNILHHQLP